MSQEELNSEVDQLRAQLALWEECADMTVKTFGNCIRPQTVTKMRTAAERMAGLVRLTDAERSAIKEASEFYIGTRTGVALGGLLERLK